MYVNKVFSEDKTEKVEFSLFYSEIAYISQQNEDLSYPPYPLVNYCFGFIDTNILDFLRLITLFWKWLCLHELSILILFFCRSLHNKCYWNHIVLYVLLWNALNSIDLMTLHLVGHMMGGPSAPPPGLYLTWLFLILMMS